MMDSKARCFPNKMIDREVEKTRLIEMRVNILPTHFGNCGWQAGETLKG